MIQVPVGEQTCVAGEVFGVHLPGFVYQFFEIWWDAGTHYAPDGIPEATTVLPVAFEERFQVSWRVEAVGRRGAQQEHPGEAFRVGESKLRDHGGAERMPDEYWFLDAQGI